MGNIAIEYEAAILRKESFEFGARKRLRVTQFKITLQIVLEVASRGLRQRFGHMPEPPIPKWNPGVNVLGAQRDQDTRSVFELGTDRQ